MVMLLTMHLLILQKSQIINEPDQPGLHIALPTSAPSTGINDQTANWKEYSSPSRRFMFRYPNDLFTVDAFEKRISFYKSPEQAQSAHDCQLRGLGTLDQPCGAVVVLNIGVSSFPKRGHTPLKDQYNINDPSLPKVKSYRDGQGRIWATLGPIPIAGAFNFEAETETTSGFHSVSIQAGLRGLENYLNKSAIEKEGRAFDYRGTRDHEQLALRILSTFVFSN